MSRKPWLVVSAALMFLAARAAFAQDCYQWIDRTPPPGPHEGASMVYDSNRNVFVVMGGTYGPNTWEWDGKVWAKRSETTPSGVGTAVFDSVRGVTLAFIGNVSPATWEWDGSTWSLRSQSGPSPRTGYRMAFDTQRGVAVLHGGRDANDHQFLNDTWEWNGSTWLLRATSGPTRTNHLMAYDSFRHVTVLLGGLDSEFENMQDTWEWDGTNWEQMTNNGPSSAIGMVFDSNRNVSIVFRMTNMREWFEEWTWDGLSWSSRLAPGPLPRPAPLAFDSKKGVAVLFGGPACCYEFEGPFPTVQEGNDKWGDLWEWDGNDWAVQWGGKPDTTAIAYDRHKDRIVAVVARAGISQVWERLGTEWTLVDSNGPAMGVDPAIAYDEARHVFVLFGGSELDSETHDWTFYDDTWEWDGSTWTLRATEGPSPRGRHKMVYDVVRGVTVLFGGWDGWQLGDTWEWDGFAWSLRATSGPSARYWYGFVYDRQRSVCVLASGGRVILGTGPTSGTWEWNGGGWTQRDQRGFGYSPAMIYDELRGVSVIVGGFSRGSADEVIYVPGTSEWDGNTWTFRTIDGFVFGTGVFDIAMGVNLVISDTPTWEYPWYLSPLETPVAESTAGCQGTCPAVKNRYLSFTPPELLDDATQMALRVTASQMPGASDCPNVGDFSDRFLTEMWVGDEVEANGADTGLYRLSDVPVFRDWSDVPGVIVHVADCNIVPCASYAVEAVSDMPCDPGVPAVYSDAVIISTSGVWADIVGSSYGELPNGIVDFTDVSACVDRFRNAINSPPRTWCDLGGDSPTQGVHLDIDFSDISLVVDAFRGRPYPFAGPTAPDPCP